MSGDNAKRDNLAIIIATKDRPAEFRRLLDSIAAQKRMPDQIIVVDGGDEPVLDILRSFPDLPIDYKRQIPASLTVQRNVGIRMLADGITIAMFLDDDVVLEKDSMAHMARFLEKSSDGTGGAQFNITNEAYRKPTFLQKIFMTTAECPNRILRSGFQGKVSCVAETIPAQWLVGCAMVFRRGVFGEFMFDERFSEYARYEDVDFTYRVGKKYPLYVVAEARVQHLSRPEDISFSVKLGKMEVVNRLYFVKKHKDLSLPLCCWALFGIFINNVIKGMVRRDPRYLRRAKGNLKGFYETSLRHPSGNTDERGTVSGQDIKPVEKAGVTQNSKSWKHIPALDGIRGLAALLVVISHFYVRIPVPTNRIARFLYNTTSLGATGVDLFFVLSGFLITGILLTMKETAHAWLNFYARRVLRIFPLYYGVLIAMTAASIMMGKHLLDLAPTWWFWTYLQNIPMTFFGGEAPGFNFPTGHLWSLAIEEHFYFVWPVLVLTLNRKNLLRILLAIIIAAIGCRAILWPLYGVKIYFFTLCRMDALALGSIIAIFWQEADSVKKMVRFSKFFFIFTLIVLMPLRIVLTGKNFDVTQYFKYTLIAAAYGAGIILVLAGSVPSIVKKLFDSRLMRNFGKYSYGIYIFHPFCFLIFANSLEGFRSTGLLLLSPLCLVGVTAFIYTVAYVSWNLYERPFLNIKRYFEYQR